VNRAGQWIDRRRNESPSRYSPVITPVQHQSVVEWVRKAIGATNEGKVMPNSTFQPDRPKSQWSRRKNEVVRILRVGFDKLRRIRRNANRKRTGVREDAVLPDGQKVRNARIASKWTQAQLAEKCGYSKKQVEDIELGKRHIGRICMADVAQALGRTLEELTIKERPNPGLRLTIASALLAIVLLATFFWLWPGKSLTDHERESVSKSQSAVVEESSNELVATPTRSEELILASVTVDSQAQATPAASTSDFGFRVESLKNSQAIRNSDVPLRITGSYRKRPPGQVWVLLQDSFGHYHLQNPPVQFQPDGKWVSSNIRPELDIERVQFGVLGDQGHAQFVKMATMSDVNNDWPGFDELPHDWTTLVVVEINRIGD
jgi:transcriptional regulator with XRE-family HTH domain